MVLNTRKSLGVGYTEYVFPFASPGSSQSRLMRVAGSNDIKYHGWRAWKSQILGDREALQVAQ